MAAAITHIVLTEKIFDKFFANKSKKEFFIGTCFPDIRKIASINRDKTHFTGLSVVDLKDEESFLAGVKFHSILELAREKFVLESGLYSLFPKSKYVVQALKILEDELFYDRVKSWDLYNNYLNDILAEEKEFGVAEPDLRKWHSLLQEYFKQEPTPETENIFLSSLGISESAVTEINENLSQMRGNKKIVEVLDELYNKFDRLVF